MNRQKTKEITTKQYAKYLGCTSQNISKHIRSKNLKFLPDVIEVKNYDRFYLLDRDVNAAINIKNFALKNHLSVERRLKNRNELPTLVGVMTSEAPTPLG
jgi:hypothetical protein